MSLSDIPIVAPARWVPLANYPECRGSCWAGRKDCPHKKLCAPAFEEAAFAELDEQPKPNWHGCTFTNSPRRGIDLGGEALIRDMPDHNARDSEPAHTEDAMRTDPVDVTTFLQVKPKPSLWARVLACLVRLRDSFGGVA